MRATRWAGPAIACIGLLLLAIGPHVQPHSKLERVPLARSHGRYEKPRPGVAESVPNVGRFQAVMGHAQFRLRRDRPVTDDRHFYIKHAVNFRARPQLMRVAPWRALYSVSMDADPQSFLQQAPETGNVGLFHGSMPHLRGESGGTPEYKYSEHMPPCPCAGVGGMCLSLFEDESSDQGPQPCECLCRSPHTARVEIEPEQEIEEKTKASGYCSDHMDSWICSHGHH